jgi:hypothetical protein
MKSGVGSFKNLKNHWARRAYIYMKAFWYNVDSSLFKSWSLECERDHNRVKHIYIGKLFACYKIWYNKNVDIKQFILEYVELIFSLNIQLSVVKSNDSIEVYDCVFFFCMLTLLYTVLHNDLWFTSDICIYLSL